MIFAYGYRLIYLSGVWIQGDYKIPEYMGIGYARTSMDGSMCYPIPFNYFISFFRAIHYAIQYPEWTIKYMRRIDFTNNKIDEIVYYGVLKLSYMREKLMPEESYDISIWLADLEKWLKDYSYSSMEQMEKHFEWKKAK